MEKITYKGYKIAIFLNSNKWDYTIENITAVGYPGTREIYETKRKAIIKAKERIDNI